MTDQPAPDFAGFLRELRVKARLTQEELAEAAGLSTRTVSDLERGVNRRAFEDTRWLLADAPCVVGPVRSRSRRSLRAGRHALARCWNWRGGGGDTDAAPRHRLVYGAAA